MNQPRDDEREDRTLIRGEDSETTDGTLPKNVSEAEETIIVDSDCQTDEQGFVPEIPSVVGRYRIKRLLGRGGFGRVYLAFDDELQRHVTVKVPNRKRIRKQADVDAFLTEARTLALLEHPNVVPVHDVGRTDESATKQNRLRHSRPVVFLSRISRRAFTPD